MKYILLLFLSSRALALAPQQFTMQAYNFSGSDTMRLTTLRFGYVSAEHESWWKTIGANIEASRGALMDNRMEAAKAYGTVVFRATSAFTIPTVVGATGLRNLRTEDVRAIPAFSVAPHYEHGDFKFGGTIASDCVYQEWVAPGVVDPFVTETKFELNLKTPIIGKLKTRASVNHLYLSDGNQRHSGDGVLLYTLSEGRLNLAAGPGIFFIGFTQQTPDYWSPEEFADYTARLEATYQINSIWSVYIAGHVGPAVDLNNKDGLDSFYEAHLVYTGLRGVHMELDWDRLQADRPEFRWMRDDITFNFTSEF